MLAQSGRVGEANAVARAPHPVPLADGERECAAPFSPLAPTGSGRDPSRKRWEGEGEQPRDAQLRYTGFSTKSYFTSSVFPLAFGVKSATSEFFTAKTT